MSGGHHVAGGKAVGLVTRQTDPVSPLSPGYQHSPPLTSHGPRPQCHSGHRPDVCGGPHGGLGARPMLHHQGRILQRGRGPGYGGRRDVGGEAEKEGGGRDV